MTAMRRFEQKTVLVTGAAMGIGGATARRLADEGAEVIVADCNEEATQRKVSEIEGAGGEAWFQYVDLASPSSIEQMGQGVGVK